MKNVYNYDRKKHVAYNQLLLEVSRLVNKKYYN